MIFDRASRAKQAESEKLWLSKMILRITAIIAAIVGIGLVGWSTASSRSTYKDHAYEYYGSLLLDLVPWPLIPLCISVFWNSANVALRLLLARPMKPSANVAADLLLWMTMAITASFLAVAALANIHFNPGYYGGFGSYVTAPNGTHVYQPFTPCADFDNNCQALNDFTDWIKHMGSVQMGGVMITLLVMLLHFILFVWACRDTHVRNANKTTIRAREMAEKMVRDMQEGGLLITATQREAQKAPLLSEDGRPMGEAPVEGHPDSRRNTQEKENPSRVRQALSLSTRILRL